MKASVCAFSILSLVKLSNHQSASPYATYSEDTTFRTNVEQTLNELNLTDEKRHMIITERSFNHSKNATIEEGDV